jgi:hypothetical protein
MKFKLATLTYRCLHGTAPLYLSALLRRVGRSDSPSPTVIFKRRALVTIGDRAFPVAAAKQWNELHGDITAPQLLTAFRHQIKTFLFRHTYLDSTQFLYGARHFFSQSRLS